MVVLFTLEYSTLYAVILIWETLKKFIASLPVLSFLSFSQFAIFENDQRNQALKRKGSPAHTHSESEALQKTRIIFSEGRHLWQ